MLRFAILTHDWPAFHWDFLLEPPIDGEFDESPPLWTWRLLGEPDSAAEIACERLPDHRRRYLDYEGPVSGDRGTVKHWDSGTYEVISHEPNFIIRVHGQRIARRIVIDDASFTFEAP